MKMYNNNNKFEYIQEWVWNQVRPLSLVTPLWLPTILRANIMEKWRSAMKDKLFTCWMHDWVVNIGYNKKYCISINHLELLVLGNEATKEVRGVSCGTNRTIILMSFLFLWFFVAIRRRKRTKVKNFFFDQSKALKSSWTSCWFKILWLCSDDK